MKSQIYTGKVMHYRAEPVEHKFNYPLYYYSFDLDNLENLEKELFLFGYNKIRPIALHDKDYLTPGNESIKVKALNYLRRNDCSDTIDKIYLITGARYFNYVFNPVSFFYCFSPNHELKYILTEINNTFGERHVYILNQSLQSDERYQHYSKKKEFHVSPFYDLRGEYDFYFSDLNQNLDIKINIMKEKRAVFFSRLWGQASELNNKNLLLTLCRFPLTAALTMPRILFEAFRLHFIKKLPAYFKPKPQSIHTIVQYQPGFIYKICQRIILKIFSNIDQGCLKINLPNGENLSFGDLSADPSLHAHININHYNFFKQLVLKGDIALGETFTQGLWDSKDLTALLELLIKNRKRIEAAANSFSLISRTFDFIKHLFFRNNSKQGAKKNISAHYDLSNDLFKLFLDESLTYSAAVFDHRGEDLHTAQIRKLDLIIKKARLKESDHVLEIGCGWGSMAIRAVQQTGCRFTCITLSQEQADYFQEKIDALKLNDKIEIIITDFRNISGQFDKIISIEMVEAIGYQNYDAYFSTFEKCLKPDGIVLIQAITFPDQQFEGLKKRCDWIQKYIFPGSLIPSVNALTEAMQNNSDLILEDLENITLSYAETLRQWRERFNQKSEQILELKFSEEFIRAWNYYFAYCEAGFESRTLNNMQMLFSRSANQSLNNFNRV